MGHKRNYKARAGPSWELRRKAKGRCWVWNLCISFNPNRSRLMIDFSPSSLQTHYLATSKLTALSGTPYKGWPTHALIQSTLSLLWLEPVPSHLPKDFLPANIPLLPNHPVVPFCLIFIIIFFMMLITSPILKKKTFIFPTLLLHFCFLLHPSEASIVTVTVISHSLLNPFQSSVFSKPHLPRSSINSIKQIQKRARHRTHFYQPHSSSE